jgi:hypothetical protein
MAVETGSGATIAGFCLESRIGDGATGVVYLARDRTGRRVALKLLLPEISEDARSRERFLREVEIAGRLDHPHIVSTIDAGEADGVLYLAMEHVDGVDLRSLLRREGPLRPERALRLIGQVASALDAAHATGLVHRDVKPGNILVTGGERGEHAYVCDFGLARHVSSVSSLTGDRGFVGTIDYVPPEQISGSPLDGRADVYSLACVLYECLAGARPFERESELAVVFAHLNEPPPTLSDARPELPSALDDVFAKGLAKSPGDRYRTCRALTEAAARAARGESAPPRARRARRGRVAVCAAALAAAGTTLGLLVSSGGPAQAAAITPTSIAGTPLGLTKRAYEHHFGQPWLLARLPTSGHVKLTFLDREVGVYFKGLSDTAVEITTWNKDYKTAAGIGPCSTITELKKAYGTRLKPSKWNTQHGQVFAYTVGKSLIFASNDHFIVDDVALYYGDAPDANKPGGALPYAGYIALSETPCPGSGVQ